MNEDMVVAQKVELDDDENHEVSMCDALFLPNYHFQPPTP